MNNNQIYSPKLKIRLINVILGFISVGIIIFCINKINLNHLLKVVTDIDHNYLFVSFVIYLSCYFIRVKRFLLLFNIGGWKKWFGLVGIFQIINRTFPFRSGEGAFPLLSKNFFKISFTESITKLFIVRIFDLLSLLLFFLLSLILIGDNNLFYIFIFCSLTLIAILFSMFNNFYLHSLFKVITFFAPGYYEKLKEIENNILKFLNQNFTLMIKIFILSILDKIANFSALIFIVYGLGYNLLLMKLLLAISLSGFTDLLPINSLGNFGTLELGWASALVYLGIDINTSIESGFSAHIIVFSFTLTIGLICYIAYNFFKPMNEKIFLINSDN